MATINGTTGYNIGTDASLAVTDDQGDAFPINALGVARKIRQVLASAPGIR